MSRDRHHVGAAERRDEPLQPSRRHRHVVVDRDEDVAGRLDEAGIARVGEPRPVFLDQARFRKVADDVRRNRGSRPVVHHDDLDRACRALRAERHQAAPKIVRPVARGDDDRDRDGRRERRFRRDPDLPLQRTLHQPPGLPVANGLTQPRGRNRAAAVVDVHAADQHACIEHEYAHARILREVVDAAEGILHLDHADGDGPVARRLHDCAPYAARILAACRRAAA